MTRITAGLVAITLVVLALWRSPASAQQPLLAGGSAKSADLPIWPDFLGPRRDGTSTETGLSWDWDKTPPKALWKVPLGNGFSSLIIVGDRLYTMSQRGQRDV